MQIVMQAPREQQEAPPGEPETGPDLHLGWWAILGLNQ